MGTVRKTDDGLTPEERAAMEARLAEEHIAKWKARFRFAGTVLLSALCMYKLAVATDQTERLTWLGALVLVLGLASFDQLLKALGKG